MYIRTSKVDEAIKVFKEAIQYCRPAGDSLCVGESLEQLSIMTALAGDFEGAQLYFTKAMSLLEKYGSKKNLCTAYSNYGSIMSVKGRPQEAMEHFEKSLQYCNEIEKYDAVASTLNNKADAFRRLK
ncbi:MAG: tetratricopeptide repeat protein [Saprospiraceae bacterium]|nr:tetratricopeptide repeat protein [Saprospiraceae bacterium]